jgi:hypothetical protein
MRTQQIFRTEPECKLQKLIPLLGSDQPGEVVATAAAIDRHLRATGRDWHDLVRQLAPDDKPPGDYPSNWRRVVSECLARASFLPPRDREFLIGLQNFANPWLRQLGWLTDCWLKVRHV